MLLEDTNPRIEKERTTITAPGAERLREISESPARSAMLRAVHFLPRLVNDTGFLEGEILPLLEGTEAAEAWYERRDRNERMRMPLAVEASIGG